MTVGVGSVDMGVQLLGAGATGLRPMSTSTSRAQSNCNGLCGTGSTLVRFVGDGVRSMGVGSVGTVLVCAVLAGLTVASLGLGLMGEAGAALMCAVRMGLTVMLSWAGLVGSGCRALCMTVTNMDLALPKMC
jgi:hypothetical protein